MQLNWLLIFEAKTAEGKRKCHPLSDPLERPEWQDSGWAIGWIAWLMHEPRAERKALAVVNPTCRQADRSASPT